MAGQTKEDILITARELFNEYGYKNISMRDIAKKLNISVGNLTYYFKKKEDLIEEVVMYKHRKYNGVLLPKSLDDLNNLFLDMLNTQNENIYYFKHFDELAEISSKIYEIQLATLNKIEKILKECFEELQRKNLVQKVEPKSHIDNLIKCILTVIIYKPIKTKDLNKQDNIDSIISCLWSMIFMYLTDEGKDMYLSIFK
ncbi:TetR/AcrR family transcriptional regulator [Sarcina ventriculi]|uniref:TetR/AcrR family transcriptional regulator n=1 Tax=Sarcina ventriculi TaxID=1267 RepID=UPI001C10FE9A|nr:TetR/AcrR family transcriptional regulator [Sarcina ventriculi]MBU5322515.1 TetR/AcrR family transcriptional regulator [Sarcina ventriculi]MDO4403087.1 TetR/AcrR family transcriptional regulator [Clostridiaceae bacterium]